MKLVAVVLGAAALAGCGGSDGPVDEVAELPATTTLECPPAGCAAPPFVAVVPSASSAGSWDEARLDDELARLENELDEPYADEGSLGPE